MSTMAMGENKSLPTTHIRAQLRWSQTAETPEVDLCALVLDSTDKVRADSDFVFYNQPEHPSQAVRLHPTTGGRFPTQTLELMLSRIPVDRSKIVVACSCDGGVLSAVADLHLVVLAGDHDAELARFTLTGGRESALIVGEIYRRRSEWKFRAVGQGYLRGLAGLATDYGILVSDADADPAVDSQVAAPTPTRIDSGAVLIEIGGLARQGVRMPDLDLCALAFNAQRKLVDIVWFLHPAEFDGAITLTNGAGSALDEPQLTARLADLPQDVQHIVLTASSLRGHQLSDWHGLTLRISDPGSGRDVVVLETAAATTASILGSLSRSGDSWIFTQLIQDKRAASGRDLVTAGSEALAGIGG